MKPTPAPTAIRAFPHVSGQTTRFKAEPTKLTGAAARVMAASGNFSTTRGAPRSSSGILLGALVLVVAAGALAVTGDARPVGGEARVTATQLALSDHLLSLGAGEYMDPAASAAKAPDTLDAQDRFEIDRLFRLTARVNAAASQELAPAAGPAR
jgi:hypothetical protein